MTLIAKPFITVCGDEFWCDQIVSFCIPNLPMEPTEWIRKRGSEFKLVHVDIDTKPFDQCHLTQSDDNFINTPLLHIFVILENDEQYNSVSKSVFSNWIGILRSRPMENWKIIIVPDSNAKAKTKFSMNKFNLFNKLKIDFNLQKIDSYAIKLSENARERFNQIQKFLRDTVLSIYDDKCFKIEDKIRIQRETRFTQLWNYFDFFYLQEELADIYECLNLYEEALAQFDESDAVFSKCIESFHKGENATWIVNFKEIPFVKIDCLILTNYSDPDKRFDLSKGQLCLADFRAYLLSRQCALLQLLNRYQEIPSLVYSTLINFLNEYRILNVEIDLNLKSCWIFLTALQALQRFSPIDCEESLAQDYAALFRLALNSINKLAASLKIWMPTKPDWSAVQILREKLSILSNDEFGDTPSSRLAGGFISQIDFQEFHTKLFEEAITIWKYIGRIRSANLLGIQLADLYYKAHQFDKAEPLYIKAIKCLRNENWAHLAMPLRLKLAVCQKDKFEKDPQKLINYLSERYLKTCVHLAGATFSSSKWCFNPDTLLKNDSEHKLYFKELINCVDILFNQTHKPQIFKLEPLCSISNVILSSPDEEGLQIIELILDSHLPQSTNVKITIFGTKFPELDLTQCQTGNDILNDLKDVNDELIDFPVQYSIPLTSVTSPKLYRTNKIENTSKKVGKEFHCQSSLDDDIYNINQGVISKITDAEIEQEENDDKLVSLICFPKQDAGLKARKISISPDVEFSLDSDTGRHSKTNNEVTTVFFSTESTKLITINPGRNVLKLKSQRHGLFIPKNIEVLMFDKRALLKDIITENILDSTWIDYGTVETFFPSIIIDDNLDNFGFINFKNQINPKIKMGLLSFPKNEIEMNIYVNNEECCRSQISTESNIIQPNEVVSLHKPLEYTLSTPMDQVTLCISDLIRKQLAISFYENISMLGNIIQTSSSKYVVSVELQRPVNTKIVGCNYQIRNPTLKLHHQNEVRQLLPLAHRSLSTGLFNDQMHFTILWILESIDIVNFEKECLKFTLSIDLTVEINEFRILSGGIVHDFELRNN